MHLSKYAWYNFHRSQTGFDDIYVTARNSRKSQLHMYTYKGCEIKRAFGRFACHVILYTILGTTSYTLSLLAVFKYWGPSRRVSGFHVDLDFRLDFSMDFFWKSTIFYSEDAAYEQWNTLFSAQTDAHRIQCYACRSAYCVHIYTFRRSITSLKNDLCIVNGKSVVYKGYSLCAHGDWISRFQIGFPDFNWIFADSVRDFWTPSCDACVI